MTKDKYRDIIECKGWGWLILLLFVFQFAAQSPLQASISKTTLQIKYIHERLTINVDNMALGTVLAAIREKTGIEFEVSRGQSEKVISIRFESLPLFDGLKRILSHLNHALLFDLDNKLVKVIILDYATADSSPRLREAADALSIQRVFSSSSVEAEDTKSVAVQERVVTSSSKVTDMTQPVGEETSSSLLLEIMDTNPSSVEDMVVTPPTETMIIHPPQTAEEDMIVIPPNGEMASPVEDMIIEGSTGKLYGWSGYAELVQANRP